MSVNERQPPPLPLARTAVEPVSLAIGALSLAARVGIVPSPSALLQTYVWSYLFPSSAKQPVQTSITELDQVMTGSISGASSSLTSLITMGAIGLGSRLLFSVYGDRITNSVSNTIGNELERFSSKQRLLNNHEKRGMQGPHTRENHHNHTTNNNNNGHWDQWLHTGRSVEHTAAASGGALSGLPLESIAVHLLLLGSMLSYLNYSGASDIKKKLAENSKRMIQIKRAQKAPHPQQQAAADISLTEISKHQVLEDWEYLAHMDGAQHAARENAPPPRNFMRQRADHMHNKAVLVAIENERHLNESFSGKLYLRSPYYNPETNPKNLNFFSVYDTHVVRVIINVLNGFILHMESLFNAGRPRQQYNQGESSSSAGVQNPFSKMTTVVAALAYSEFLARALRLYGWAPVTLAVQAVIAQLWSQTQQQQHH